MKKFWLLVLLCVSVNYRAFGHYYKKIMRDIFSYCKTHQKMTIGLLGALGFVSFIKGVAYFLDRQTKRDKTEDCTNYGSKNDFRSFLCPCIDGCYDNNEQVNLFCKILQWNHLKKGIGSGLDLNTDIINFLCSLRDSSKEDDKNKKNNMKYNIFGQSYGGYVVLAALNALQTSNHYFLRKAKIFDQERIDICDKLKQGIIFIDSPVFDFKLSLYGMSDLINEIKRVDCSVDNSITSLIFTFLLGGFKRSLYYLVLPIATNFRMYPGRFKSFKQGVPELLDQFNIIFSTCERDLITGGISSCQNFITLSKSKTNLKGITIVYNQCNKEEKTEIKKEGVKYIERHSFIFSAPEEFFHNFTLEKSSSVLIVEKDENDPTRHCLRNAISIFTGLVEKNSNNSD